MDGGKCREGFVEGRKDEEGTGGGPGLVGECSEVYGLDNIVRLQQSAQR